MNLTEIRSTTLYQTNLPYCVSKAFLTCYVTKGLLLCVSKSEFTVTIEIFYCYCNCLLTLGLRHSVRKKVYLNYILNCGVTKGHIICNFGLPHCVTIYTDIYVHVYFFCVDNTCN